MARKSGKSQRKNNKMTFDQRAATIGYTVRNRCQKMLRDKMPLVCSQSACERETVPGYVIPLANAEKPDDKEREKQAKEEQTGEGPPRGEDRCH